MLRLVRHAPTQLRGKAELLRDTAGLFVDVEVSESRGCCAVELRDLSQPEHSRDGEFSISHSFCDRR